MSGRPIEPIPLWRPELRLATACALAAAVLLVLACYLASNALELRLQAVELAANPPPPAPSPPASPS